MIIKTSRANNIIDKNIVTVEKTEAVTPVVNKNGKKAQSKIKVEKKSAIKIEESVDKEIKRSLLDEVLEEQAALED